MQKRIKLNIKIGQKERGNLKKKEKGEKEKNKKRNK